MLGGRGKGKKKFFPIANTPIGHFKKGGEIPRMPTKQRGNSIKRKTIYPEHIAHKTTKRKGGPHRKETREVFWHLTRNPPKQRGVAPEKMTKKNVLVGDVRNRPKGNSNPRCGQKVTSSNAAVMWQRGKNTRISRRALGPPCLLSKNTRDQGPT